MSLVMPKDPRRGEDAPVPRRGQASPLGPVHPGWPDPYRLLFPIGLTWGLIGAGLWPLHALGVMAYPGVTHRALMIQGFEHAFVLGFLLTAIPGFTKGERCRPAELVIAAICAALFGLATLAGQPVVAQGAFAISVVMLLVALLRRVRHARVAPPLEMMFVGFGLLMGLAGGLWQLAEAAGGPAWFAAAPPRFGERLVSLGMVLSLVLGVGGLLVPTFAGMRDPLVIPGIAGPHDWRGRMRFYAGLITMLALAFAAEMTGHPRWGALLRALAASVITLAVWKLARAPGRRDVPAFVLWTSGWLIMAGLWAMALGPRFALGGLHVVFIGGFSLLTLGIGTRVVVVHGRHPLADERRTLTGWVVASIALALAARLAAEWTPDRASLMLGTSGALWAAAWALWALRAMPRIGRMAAGAVAPRGPGAPAARPAR